MPPTALIVAVTILVPAVLVLAILLIVLRRRFHERLRRLNQEIVEVSADAAVGRRLRPADDPVLGPLGRSLNRLFDALAEKDEAVFERDRALRRLVRTMPEVVLLHDDRVQLANESAARLVGLEAEQLQGRPVSDLVRPAFRALFRRTVSRLLAGEIGPQTLEMQLINGGEQGMWVEAGMAVVDWGDRQLVLTVGRDISHRHENDSGLRGDRRQALTVLESIGDGVITTDGRGRIEYMNGEAELLTGYSRDESEGRPFGEIMQLIDELDKRSLGDPVERCLSMRQRVNMGRRALMLGRDDEHEHSVELTASPIRAGDGGIQGVVVVFHDVSEMRGLTRQMSYQAAHDALTGLINRRELERRLEEAIDNARREKANHVLCYMDLDRFKAVNDTCGHMAGDALLREVASLIKDQVRDSDSVARIGGDEFGMLLMGCPLEKARQIAGDVVQAVADHRFVWQDRIFTIGVSVGIVELGPDSGSVQDMLAAADSACYMAKQQGRGQVHVYSSADEAAARERGEIQWLRRLQDALSNGGFVLATQPIIALDAERESGPAMEVLLRFQDAQGRTESPKDFLPAAEQYHLMPRIDRWVVSATLTAVAAGDIRVPAGRSCIINLSGQTLGDADFLEFVVESLDRTSVAPARICFEMTEAALIMEPREAQRFIEVLHGMGCKFALDDFGSGLGAFSNLKHLPIDYLKIDGSFTRHLGRDPVNQEMVSAMIKLARKMNFRTVAEQVEEQHDFDMLREMGVDFAQGYLIDRPRLLGAGPN
jgi:diguanylate cyclase (GGDEF)-like protein/PAS domain S-box-containing protein